MTRRIGTFLHLFGAFLAVLAVLVAVVWNGWTIQQRQQSRENFNAIFKDNINSQTPEASALPTLLPQAYAQVRASTEALKRSLMFGGILVIGGLAAYGLGWTARNATRRSKK
ncbi:MAG: hypothetical protein ACI8S3_002263 [Alphaproteobacteria bacterium]|jgi:hypothetical protein